MGTQSERRAATRSRLLAAAAELFSTRGVDAVSVDAVADAAGRTSGAVYDHFGSKQGLVLCLLDELKQSVVAGVLADFESAVDLAGRLRAVAASLVTDPSEETRRLLQLEQELGLRAVRDPQVATVMSQRAQQAQQWLTKGFADWVDRGLLESSLEPAVLATAFRAAVTGLTAQQRSDPAAIDLDTATACLALAVGAQLAPAG